MSVKSETTTSTTSVAESKEELPISSVCFEHKVYIVFSKWDVKKIVQFCSTYGEVFWSRLVYDKTGHETDRTLMILPDETFDSLVEDGFGFTDRKLKGSSKPAGLRIAPYILREEQEHDDEPTLFVPAPREHCDSAVAVETVVDNKLQALASCAIIPENSWRFETPSRSREAGDVKSGTFIMFSDDVERDRIAMVRILINDTYWPVLEDQEAASVFRCYWARSRTEVPKRTERTDRTKTSSGEKSGSDERKLTPEERAKLQEERRLAHVARLLKQAEPSHETEVVVKGKKYVAKQPTAKK